MSSDNIKKLLAGVIGLAALLLIVSRFMGAGGGFDSRAAGESITIECSETGATWEMERGRLFDALASRPYPIDPEQGLSSPEADGRPVAFPQDRKLWERMVRDVNSAQEALKKKD